MAEPMDEVKCYLCGQQYEPTAIASMKHVKHTQGRSYRATPEQLAVWLESCQFERDSALRTIEDVQAELQAQADG